MYDENQNDQTSFFMLLHTDALKYPSVQETDTFLQ